MFSAGARQIHVWPHGAEQPWLNQLGDTQMKLTKLLTGAAVAALLSTGAASAQYTLAADLGDADGAVAPLGTYYIASNLDFAAANLTGTLNVLLTESAADWDATGAAAALLEIDLTGMIFDQSVLDTDFTAGCSATVVDGGNAGDSTVTFEIADITCADTLGLEGGQVLYTGGTGNVSTSLTRVSNGNPIDGGSEVLDVSASDGTQPLISNLPGFQVRALSTGAIAAELPGYATIDPTTGATLRVNVGLYEVSTLDIPVFQDLASTQAAVPASSDIVVTFEDDTGLDLEAFELDGSTGDVSGLTVEFAGAALALNSNDFTVEIFEDALNPGGIQEQDVIAAVTAEYAPSSALADTGGSVRVANIDREGTSTGPFEWVGDASAANFSVFRHLGFDPADLPTVSVVLSNSTVDGFDGEYPLDLSGLTVSDGGEVVFSSRELGNQIGAFGRADVEFFFEGNGFSTRRFIASANGTLTTFDGDFGQSCSGTTTAGDIDVTGVTGTLTVAGAAAQTGDTIAYTGSVTQDNGTVSMTCSQ